MLFEYRRSLRKAQLLELISYVVFIALFLALAAYFVFILREPSSISGGKAMFVIIGFVIPFLIWNLIRLNRATGEWKVLVTSNEVVWQAPENIGEESFSLQFHEISAIVYEYSRSSENDNCYFIETVTGKIYPLHQSFSGIPIGRFCRSLKKAGVKYETRVRN